LIQIEQQIRRENVRAPVFHANHAIVALRSSECPACAQPDCSIDQLRQKRFFAFYGVGNPQSLDRQLKQWSGQYLGCRCFGDHHQYTPRQIARLKADASQAGAQLILTTEKDWVKIADFPQAHEGQPPIYRLELRIAFWGEDEGNLLGQILQTIKTARGLPAQSPSG
jgi:tetraacyldisaccharide 4'-kinase